MILNITWWLAIVIIEPKLRAGTSMITFLPSNDTQCLQTNMRISAKSENRVSTWITLTTHKNRVRLAEESIFRVQYSKQIRVTARPPSRPRTFGPLRANICSWLVNVFRILARFGTRSIQFGRLRPGRGFRIAESRAI